MTEPDPDGAPRVAIVTGGARNIGAATCGLLASNGWHVAIWDLNGEEAQATAEHISAGGVAAGFAVDVTDESRVAEAVAAVVSQLGVPTALVNNVGLTANQTLLETTMADWDRTLNSCLTSAMLCMREVAPRMIDQGRGRSSTSRRPLGTVATWASSPMASRRRGALT